MQKLVGTHFYLVALCIAAITWWPCARRPASRQAGSHLASKLCAIARKSARPFAPARAGAAWAIGNIGNIVAPEKSRRKRSAVQHYPKYLLFWTSEIKRQYCLFAVNPL
jgi:hypothetical protein